ncbi:unnamed protein product [marine sediment metagenome]|uniref:Uncharacterized protein n=1 Tax=marine sediment metagenome TaxID=412755 RepID=X1AA73_9ZZZZ
MFDIGSEFFIFLFTAFITSSSVNQLNWEKTINYINVVYFMLDEKMNMWTVPSLMNRHYLSPMDFVELDALFLITEEGYE